MVDCILVGHNDGDFASYVKMVGGMGPRSGGYRDLLLSFVTLNGTPTRPLDVLNSFQMPDAYGSRRKYHNFELLWPAVLYLASYLDRHGFSFDYVNLYHEEAKEFAEKLAAGPRAVAITTTLYVTADPIMEIVRFVRRHSPETTVIVGGPFVAGAAREWKPSDLSTLFSMIGADVYINSSEGELALTRVLDALRSDRTCHGIPNVIFRDGTEFVFNDSEIESNPLDANMVDYSLFSLPSQFVSLRTAKSCPYSCSFCGFPARAGKYVYLSPDLVEAELDHIKEHGSVTSLTFVDDTFNVPKGRFKKVLRMMIEKQYGFRWNCFYRSDHGDDEVIDLMAEAGCEGVFLGVESGSDQMLESMNKSARRKDYLHAIPRLRSVGIATHANLIVGFPGEDDHTIACTQDLLAQAQPDFYRAQLWYADPITPVWARRDELGIAGSRFAWSHRTMDSDRAADLVDDLFSTVRDSVWLPQYGFDFWSVFYLQRRGMTLAQVKKLLQAFNAAVAENVGRAAPAEISPAALERLKAACNFG